MSALGSNPSPSDGAKAMATRYQGFLLTIQPYDYNVVLKDRKQVDYCLDSLRVLFIPLSII